LVFQAIAFSLDDDCFAVMHQLYCRACGHTLVHNFTGREGKLMLVAPPDHFEVLVPGGAKI
jgi:hypothetical protein